MSTFYCASRTLHVCLEKGVRGQFCRSRTHSGQTIRFHCLFCHGYEERNAPSAGILAVGSIGNPTMALHLARMAKRLAKIVTVYTNGDDKLAEGITKEAINDDNISVQSLPIQRLEKGAEGSSVVVHLPGGKTVTEGFLVSFPFPSASPENGTARSMATKLILILQSGS